MAMNTLNQIKMMTPEQQAQFIANTCNQMGVSLDQIKLFLGKQ